MGKLMDQFSAGDGKQLFDNWKTAFKSAPKSGASSTNDSLSLSLYIYIEQRWLTWEKKSNHAGAKWAWTE